MSSVVVAWVLGCAGTVSTSDDKRVTTPTGDTGSLPTTDTTPPSETGDSGAPTGDTGGTTTTIAVYPQPTSLTAECAPTSNALRFTCHVTVDPPQPVQITFAKSDGTGVERVHQSLVVAGEHDLPLYFLAEETEYAFTASAVSWPDDPVATGAVTTTQPPEDVRASLVVTGASSTPYVGTNLPCGAGATGGIFDTSTGELLWYEVADPGGSFGGYQMIQYTEDHTLLGQSGEQVMEIDLAGQELLRMEYGVDFFDDLHHDLIKRDGLIYVVYREPGPVLLDGFLVWDSTGAELARWFAGDHLAVPATASGDWMHTNTIWVQDGFVYLSLFTQNSLLKIDGDLASPTFGELQWVLAGDDPAGLGQDFEVDWSPVDGVDAFGHQHHLNLAADGRLMMLDNNHGRGLVVSVDEVALTATVDEAYDASFGACGPQGTTTATAAGNLLVDCSGLAIREYAPLGTRPVWTAQLSCENGAGGGGPGGTAERWYPLDGW